MLRVMPKGADVNDHGRNAIRFEDPRGVPHGHMTDWSSGDQERGVHPSVFEVARPLRSMLGQEPQL